MSAPGALYRALYYTVYTLLGWAVKFLFPLRVFGRQNLKGGRGFVLAPNHLRAIDPLYVILARGFGRRMLILGKDELFHINPFINFCWKMFGVLPVDRGTGNRDAVDAASAEVEGGGGLLIFPEGTRSKDGRLGRMKSGAFVVAQQAGADVIPCAIRYAGGKPRPFRRIYISFGTPLTLEKLGLAGEYSARKLRGAKQVFTDALVALIAENDERLERRA
jgi:1-acyl-sn-glycerol-3-phosphate acyltransferase